MSDGYARADSEDFWEDESQGHQFNDMDASSMLLDPDLLQAH
ncbi:hypothetical protein CAter282_4347 [Collimonas arenae]|uniref:Uncharacterized protein n=1 Tax=Collimonas arenae TaxID=279058 RepID=A0A127QPU4_9BURK|nr:hypothetical protein CAter10_4723 [Collimonas arenae]AMP12007.1 hypothetical protein CAter282_4347 [Collimonas arenae]